MSERTFDRETLLDLMVNIIPLGIILFFVALFLLVNPWEFDPLIQLISMGLLVVPFVALAFLTYVSGRTIARDEQRDETATDEFSATDDTDAEQASADDTDDMTAAGRPDDPGNGGDGTGADESDVDENTTDENTTDENTTDENTTDENTTDETNG